MDHICWFIPRLSWSFQEPPRYQRSPTSAPKSGQLLDQAFKEGMFSCLQANAMGWRYREAPRLLLPALCGALAGYGLRSLISSRRAICAQEPALDECEEILALWFDGDITELYNTRWFCPPSSKHQVMILVRLLTVYLHRH